MGAWARLIDWIDHDWDRIPAAQRGLFIMATGWLALMLIDRNVVTLSLAGAWSAFWLGLYLWRFKAFVRKLDQRARKKRKSP